MKVPADYICEHGMPQPWATCTDCMLLPKDLQPVPPPPPPKPKPIKAARKRSASTGAARSPRSSTARPRVSTRLPRSDADDVPPLFGDKDLAYEIPASNVRYHVQGSDNDWLPISSMPAELREHGFVYLQVDRDLVARCRVKGIGFRERRWEHGAPGTTADAGPGATLELDGDHWDFVSLDLGPEALTEIKGYRYVISLPDGTACLPEAADDHD